VQGGVRRVVAFVAIAFACSGCLATEAARTGRLFGTYVDTGHGVAPGYQQRLKEFSLLEVWSSWTQLEPRDDAWNFAGTDRQFKLVKSLDADAKSSALIWASSAKYTPDYVRALSADQLRSELSQHIRTFVHRYPSVLVWNVVNEPFNADGSLRDNVFRKKLGDGYIRIALRAAYAANPRATFVAINEYNADSVNQKSTGMLAYYRHFLVGAIPSSHLAVGLQMHMDTCAGPFVNPSPISVGKNIARFAGADVRVHITEMDYGVRCVPGTLAQKLEAQRRKFHDITAACVAVPRCRSISTWGVGDSDSWFRWSLHNPDWPLLFDDAYNPKPGYDGVVTALSGR
jgi:endo-1,4-beta-xylanase